jgi:hypothetical protein
VETLRTGDESIIAAAARERHRVATEELIQRTDVVVGSGADWLKFAAACAADKELRHNFLRRATMMDMSPPGLLRAA